MDSTKPLNENGAAGEPGSIRQLSVPGGRLRIAGTVNDSIVDGEGYRYSIFTQGCPHECPGCHNPQTHDFQGGREVEPDKILRAVLANPLLEGVTFSGGEPFCQAAVLSGLAAQLHENGLNIWCYSGYDFEKDMLTGNLGPWEITEEMLSYIDVLVDGEFKLELKNPNLRFRGSENQRVILVQESLKADGIVQWDDGEGLSI